MVVVVVSARVEAELNELRKEEARGACVLHGVC